MDLKEQIANTIKSNLEWSISKSFFDYHVKNLHMIRVSPNALLYVAPFDHLLHTNSEQTHFKDQSVGFHSHQCDVKFTLLRAQSMNKGVKPHLINMRATLEPEHPSRIQYWPRFGVYKHRRKSQIQPGESNFERVGTRDLYISEHIKCMMLGESIQTKALDLHTVYGTKDCMFAFLAEKGEDNPGFEGLHYSTSDLTKFSDKDLYHSMNASQHADVLKMIGIEI